MPWVVALFDCSPYFRDSFLTAQAVHLHLGHGVPHSPGLRFEKLSLKTVPCCLVVGDLLSLRGRQPVIIEEDTHIPFHFSIQHLSVSLFFSLLFRPSIRSFSTGYELGKTPLLAPLQKRG